MTHVPSIADIRREYGSIILSEETLAADPFEQFHQWFADALKIAAIDPNAMVLSTVDNQGHPDSRVVLLKGIEQGSFVFYTNYLSIKGQHLAKCPFAALNFHWPQLARQVRVKGSVEQLTAEQSDIYFQSRPLLSQLGAIISPQSQPIKARSELEHALEAAIQQATVKPPQRPQHWGGYRVIAQEIEFWQGRDNRLHDRFQFYYQNNQWLKHRLAP